MPAAATPNNSRTAPTRRTSWAEAAAVADAQAEVEAGPEAPAEVPSPVSASAPALPTSQPATSRRAVPAEPSTPPSAAAPQETAPAAVPAQRGTSRQAAKLAAADAPVSDFITSPGSFVRQQKPRPRGGFRGALFAMTGGAINLGPGPRQREEDELGRRISRQLQGSYNTAVLSLKGGIGKTSTTVGVGLTLAEFRGDAPCAIDANPDSGDLVERALGEGIYQQASPRTITDLLKNIESVDSLTALARYMHHAGRLHLIAGEQDPEVSDSLTAEEYLRIRKLISGYYSVALTDCGTGVTHNAMSGILQSADNLVIAAGYAVSGAKRARSTLQWLAHHGYEDLARNAIVVITDKDEVSSRVDKDAIEEHLSGICRQLIAVPHDRGVADGDLVTLDVLRPETRRAYKEIAAAIVDGYV
ncbi:MinD/ParA family ATP-binding protein [Arthrobacter oryzae]|jgi:MinD-like ATPase involved in chromosome partitioning or flagellar assembly|uniref:MinD/ParA family ATP-binding protein n=1 Tax=Arthrobacter oryzae TaxID=409290 RepID=UPI0027843547|nr:MinD-like ATPase involved in chromosome partitioning or flagellar assembly [Arthrobacter oryzae]